MYLIDCAKSGCTNTISAYDVDVEGHGWVEVGDDWYCAEHAREAPSPSEVVGFSGPEDGSEQRYRARRRSRPWAEHSAWWFIHNAVAHPLIAFLPLRPFFQFHDWTSRKMHGK